MTYHYYKLTGDSLNALNRLVEFDDMRDEDEGSDLIEYLNQLVKRPADSDDVREAKEKKKKDLKAHFTDAQIRAYQSALGFDKPAVIVNDYGDGLLRAYHVMPKIAMNPGSSKRAFGLIRTLEEAGLVNEKPQVNAGRTAFYASPEDYTGAHFIPPGAIPVSRAELDVYGPMENMFEYRETYDEGIAVPPAFDAAAYPPPRAPARHLIDNFNHFFLLGHDMQARAQAWREQSGPWTDAYQQFCDKFYTAVRAEMPDVGNNMTVWIEEADSPTSKRLFGDNAQRCLMLEIPSKILGDNWDLLELYFNILTVKKSPSRPGCDHFYATPAQDTAFGINTAKDLQLVPVRLPEPPFLSQMSALSDRHPVYETDITGFPDYYRIERYEDAAVKLLVIDLPQIKSINMPPDFTPVSPDDYNALRGGTGKTPTHIFRIGGQTYDDLAAYDTYHRRQLAEEAAFWQLFDSLLVNKPRPEDGIERPYISYSTDPTRHKSLMFDLSERLYRANEAVMKDCFAITHLSHPQQEDQRHAFYFDTIRTDTPAGKMLSDALYALSPQMAFPTALNSLFGFDRNGGYGFMDVQPMNGLDQHAILWSFPSFITAVHTPPDCTPLTRREYATLVLDSADISGGSVPPPRPADLTHLPMPGGQKSYTHIKNLKDGKDKDGLPLHEKTVIGWFKKPRTR
jgi:hypothetical protein